MKKVPISKAATQLKQLVESVTESRLPVLLTTHQASAVLVSLHDWNTIEQSLYQLSMPRLARASTAKDRS